MLTGGCYCGAIRYETAGPVSSQANCHCEMCRGTTGAPCVAWFTVPRAAFRLVCGFPTRFRSSDHATRSFCPTCGTQISFADDALQDEIDITTCSLDDPNQVPPRHHIFTDSQIPWLKLGDGLPTYRRSKSEA
jgi:hypothetical protein